jgi:hypothetical protein
MLALYLFLLVIGGGFAALSLMGDVLGGASAELELDSSLDLDTALEAEGIGWWEALSLQTFVYAAFGAGATGTLLHLLWDGRQPVLTGLLAVGAGMASGTLATLLLNYLKRSGSGEVRGESSFEGLPASVTLPLRPGTPGRIRVRRGAREFVLRALPYRESDEGSGGEPPEDWKRVVVVEVKGGVAYVTPAGLELGGGSETGRLSG